MEDENEEHAVAVAADADADSEEEGSSASDPDSDSDDTDADADTDTDSESSRSNATEDSHHPDEVVVRGFREAVTLLEDPNDRSPIEDLTVRMPSRTDRNHRDASFFRRFVELLNWQQQPQQQIEGGGRRTVRGIHLYVDWSRFPDDDDMERLFRDALPGHPTLQCIDIEIDGLPARYLRMLTESIPVFAAAASSSSSNAPLLHLYIGDVVEADPAIKAQAVEAIVNMLNRNAAVECLMLTFAVDPQQCQLICHAAPRCANLGQLDLTVTEVHVNTLNGIAASSSLKQLSIRGNISEAAVMFLARQLRTNVTLEELELVDDSDAAAGATGGYEYFRKYWALVELVKTYNYTLHHVEAGGRGMMALLVPYLDRNRRNRWQLQRLQDPDPEQRLVAPTKGLVPHFLCRTSGTPTATYRVMKHWYVHEVMMTTAGHRLRSGGRKRAGIPAPGAAGEAIGGDRLKLLCRGHVPTKRR